MQGNRGFGVRPDGSSIVPVYDMMTDDPRRHGLYLDRRSRQFLTNFADLSDNYDPHSGLMIDAGLYDGLGTLLPLGAYWYDLVHGSEVNMFSIGRCFDIFTVDQLRDTYLEPYKRMVQLHKYEDSEFAFLDYVQQRRNPKYNKVKYSLPDYMYMVRDGQVTQVKSAPKIKGLDPAKYRPYESPPETIRYWYHDGSDSLFVTQPGEDVPESMTYECDELSYEQYCSIKARQEKGEGEEDLSIDEFDPFNIL